MKERSGVAILLRSKEARTKVPKAACEFLLCKKKVSALQSVQRAIDHDVLYFYFILMKARKSHPALFVLHKGSAMTLSGKKVGGSDWRYRSRV